MNLTIIGVLVVLLGLFAFFARPVFVITTALLLSLLGSGAAIGLPALGGASVLAGPLFTGFVVLRMLLIPGGPHHMLAALRLPSPGFWLMLAVAYGILAAFLIAPYFYGKILVYSLGRGGAATTLFLLAPLGSSSANITQSVYAIGELLLFCAMSAMMQYGQARTIALKALVLLGGMHVLVSFLDVATFYTHTAFLIEWLRETTNIAWQSNTVAGLKRISGLYPEASMYSIYAMTVCGVLLSLMTNGYRPRITGPLFYMTLFFLIISTSSTAYAGLAIASALLLSVSIYATVAQGRARLLVLLLQLVLLGSLLLTAIVFLVPDIYNQLTNMLDQMVLSKMDSASAADRGNLNEMAFKSFVDTWGLGVGLGGARTSSFAVAMLSNVGLFGTICYVVFLYGCTKANRSRGAPGSPEQKSDAAILARAAGSGMIGGFIGAAVSLQIFDLGTLFYMLAAFAAPAVVRAPAMRRARPQGAMARPMGTAPAERASP